MNRQAALPVMRISRKNSANCPQRPKPSSQFPPARRLALRSQGDFATAPFQQRPAARSSALQSSASFFCFRTTGSLPFEPTFLQTASDEIATAVVK